MNRASRFIRKLLPIQFVLLTAFACPAFSEDVNKLMRKAELGDPEAQYMLGNAYFSGITIPRNYSEAVKWYRKAEEQGDPDAPVMLAIAYEKGFGVPRDDSLAYVWYSMAASKRTGNSYANYARWKEDAAKLLTPEQRAKAEQMIRDLQARRPKK